MFSSDFFKGGIMESIGKLFDRSIAHYEKKEYGAAEKAIDELLEQHAEFQRGRFLKAVILEETGRAVEAEQHYAKSGNRVTLWFRLASQLEAIDPDRARTYYLRAAEADPHNNALWFNLGTLYEKTGRTEDAAVCFGKMQVFREVLSRVVIPLGFLIIMISGARMIIQRGDMALAAVVSASALFCLFWLKRDGGTAVQMMMKKNKYR